MLTCLPTIQHAEDAQQAFSADSAPTLYNALPAIEKMYAAWEKSLGKAKYKPFIPALEAGMAKLDEYYQKTAESGAHIMAMREFHFPQLCYSWLCTYTLVQSSTLHENYYISRSIGMRTS
ncbi:hypothetical protein CPC08DRAFT_417874 [Agrocybe pediades]|nr:hypothetical protein CPC08DRAFT_417874 [Agrocybe pediades]